MLHAVPAHIRVTQWGDGRTRHRDADVTAEPNTTV